MAHKMGVFVGGLCVWDRKGRPYPGSPGKCQAVDWQRMKDRGRTRGGKKGWGGAFEKKSINTVFKPQQHTISHQANKSTGDLRVNVSTLQRHWTENAEVSVWGESNLLTTVVSRNKPGCPWERPKPASGQGRTDRGRKGGLKERFIKATVQSCPGDFLHSVSQVAYGDTDEGREGRNELGDASCPPAAPSELSSLVPRSPPPVTP
ncbi:unnamed protein product [Pleuronectes platessa]|uniref:Uncharacterized protein n=1 Tax=Pleuronectes platessa TaxID=8262 RepID=A0A9N7V221_PLEPL|nr:unnamed protein product [Pleuronectes platessa]